MKSPSSNNLNSIIIKDETDKKEIHSEQQTHNTNNNKQNHTIEVSKVSKLSKTIENDETIKNFILSLKNQIKELKNEVVNKELTYINEIKQVKTKNSLQIKGREKEIKEIFEEMNQEREGFAYENKKLKEENQELSLRNKQLEEEIVGLNMKKEGQFLNDFHEKSVLYEGQLRSLEEKYSTIIKNISNDTISDEVSSMTTNKRISYENKIKLLYEELHLKDKKILNIEYNSQVLYKEILLLNEAISNDKSQLLTKINKENGLSFEEQNTITKLEAEINKIKSKYENRLKEIIENYENLIESCQLDVVKLTESMRSEKNEKERLVNENNHIKNECEVYKNKSEEMRIKYIEYINTYDSIVTENQVLRNENQILKSNLNSLNLNISRFINSKMDELEIRKDIERKYEEKISLLERSLVKYEKENSVLKQEIESKYEKYDKSIREYEDIKRSLSEVTIEMNEYMNKFNKIHKEMKENEENLGKEKKKYCDLENKYIEIKNFSNNLLQIKAEYEILCIKSKKLEEEVKNLQNDYEFLSNKYNQMKSEGSNTIMKYKSMINSYENEIKSGSFEKIVLLESILYEKKGYIKEIKEVFLNLTSVFNLSLEDKENPIENENFIIEDMIPIEKIRKLTESLIQKYTIVKNTYIIQNQKEDERNSSEIQKLKEKIEVKKKEIQRKDEEILGLRLKVKEEHIKEKYEMSGLIRNLLQITSHTNISQSPNSNTTRVYDSFEKSTIISFFETLLVRLRLKNIQHQYENLLIKSEDTSSKGTQGKDYLNTFMSSLHSKFDELVKRSISYFIYDDVMSIIEKNKSFFNFSIENLMKAMLQNKSIVKEEVVLKMSVNEFNSLIDMHVNSSFKYWDELERKIKEYYCKLTSKIEDCVEFILNESSVDHEFVSRVLFVGRRNE